MNDMTDCTCVTRTVVHLKTGKEYTRALREVIDCTNERDGTRCVLYTDGENLYVREASEFREKFRDA